MKAGGTKEHGAMQGVLQKQKKPTAGVITAGSCCVNSTFRLFALSFSQPQTPAACCFDLHDSVFVGTDSWGSCFPVITNAAARCL